MDMGSLLGFWLVAGLLVCTPGADWAFAISAGVARRSIVPPIAGVLSGYTIVVALIAVGLGALVIANPLLLTGLTLIGAAYLIWLGLTTLLRAPAELTLTSEGSVSPSAWRDFARGAGTSGLNPKGLLLLLALLPQFTATTAVLPVSLQMLALGGVHILNCAVVYTGVALLSRRVLGARPGLAALVSRFSGGAMMLVGLVLLVEQALTLR